MGSDGHFSWADGSVVCYGNLALSNPAAFPVLAVSRSNDVHWSAPVNASTTDNPVYLNDGAAFLVTALALRFITDRNASTGRVLAVSAVVGLVTILVDLFG